MNSSVWDPALMPGYSTVETLLEEVSKNMAASNLARFRGHNAQRTSGSMRVSKPGSASNSPRNSGLGRRMTDGSYRRRLAVMDQNVTSSGNFVSNDGLYPPVQRAARPVSWHPSSYLPQEPCYQPVYPYTEAKNPYPQYDLPSTPGVYSGYATPASTFSPVSAPYTGFEPQSYNPQSRPHSQHPTNMPYLVQPITITTTNTDPSMYSHFDWSNCAANGFEDSTTPPTPENFLPIQHPEPNFSSEDSIPYHSLDDSDDTGEELVGMGLYDSPEGTKSPHSDPHLDNYRSLMMSQLMGTPYRRPESTGKGLKLEETWEPPASDDGEEEEDGEGEDDDNDQSPAVEASSRNVVVESWGDRINNPTYIGQGTNIDGWL